MEDEQTLRRYITCDAERCGQGHPAHRCSNCKTVYYCSRDCQKADWKRHKVVCHSVEKMKRLTAVVDDLNQMEDITGISQGNAETAGPCGICLEETIVDPIVFNHCKHAFCYSCLIRYQTFHRTSSGANCPYCRSEIPDLSQSMTTKVSLIAARVQRGDLSVEERNQLLDQALADVQKVCDNGGPPMNIIFTHDRARLLSLRGETVVALKELQDDLPEWTELAEKGAKIEAIMMKCRAMNLDFNDEVKKYNLGTPGGVLRKEALVQLHLQIAELQMTLENWQAAADTYLFLHEGFQVGPEMSIIQQRELFQNFQKCAYSMKNYNLAISLGEASLKGLRSDSCAHHTLARAYKGIGNMEEARTLAAKAILYEAPWDDENKKNSWELWKEINAV